MSNEQFKWKSITYYVDVDTGKQIDKSDIGTKYIKGALIDSNVRIDHEHYVKTIYRTVACSKLNAIQLNLNL